MKQYLRRLLFNILEPDFRYLGDKVNQANAAISLVTLSLGGIACKAGIPLEELINIVKVSGNEVIRKRPDQAVFIHELISESLPHSRGTLQ